MSTSVPTMSDVARHAGVALKTVSRVVNRAGHVSAEKQGRVQAAIEALGYQRNEAARLLRTRELPRARNLTLETWSSRIPVTEHHWLRAAVDGASAESVVTILRNSAGAPVAAVVPLSMIPAGMHSWNGVDDVRESGNEK